MCQMVFIVVTRSDFRGATAPPPLASTWAFSDVWGSAPYRAQVHLPLLSALISCLSALPCRPCHSHERHTVALAAATMRGACRVLRRGGFLLRKRGAIRLSSLRLVFFAFSVYGERAVAYFSFTKLVRSFTVARAGLHFVFLRFSLTAKRQSPLLPSSSLRPHF